MCGRGDVGPLFMMRNLRWCILLAIVALTILADVQAHARFWSVDRTQATHSIQSVQQTTQPQQDWIAVGPAFSLLPASTVVGTSDIPITAEAVLQPSEPNLQRAPPSSAIH